MCAPGAAHGTRRLRVRGGPHPLQIKLGEVLGPFEYPLFFRPAVACVVAGSVKRVLVGVAEGRDCLQGVLRVGARCKWQPGRQALPLLCLGAGCHRGRPGGRSGDIASPRHRRPAGQGESSRGESCLWFAGAARVARRFARDAWRAAQPQGRGADRVFLWFGMQWVRQRARIARGWREGACADRPGAGVMAVRGKEEAAVVGETRGQSHRSPPALLGGALGGWAWLAKWRPGL
jgi:hypothetical protein